MSTINITAENDGCVGNVVGADYTAVRNSAMGDASSHYTIIVGQDTRPAVLRGFMTFPIPAGTVYSAASLFIMGFDNASTDDFDIYLLAASYGYPLSQVSFNDFSGWAASGVYSVTPLNNTWRSMDYPGDDVWWEIPLNAAGLAAVEAAAGTNLLLAIVSVEDCNESAPTSYERISFYSSTEADKEPYLQLVYTPPTVYTIDVGGELEFAGDVSEVCEFHINTGGELDLEGTLTGGSMDWIEIHPWQTWKGEWDTLTEYSLYDVVLYQDGLNIHAFVSKTGHNIGNLPTDPAHWDRLVQTKWRM